MSGICFTIFAVISNVFAAGLSQICGQEIGKANVEKSGKVFSTVLLVTTVVSIIVAISGVALSAQIADLIGAGSETGELHNLAKSYINGFCIGAPGHILVAMLIPEVQLSGQNKRVFASIAVLTVADVIGDFVNVLILHWGMFGMGLSTSISYYAGMFVLLQCFRNNKLFRINFKNPDFKILHEVFKIGVPRATKRIGNIIRPLIIMRLILAAGGVAAVSAFSVEQNVRYVVESLGVGIGGGIFLLAGIFFGEKDYRMIKSCCRVSIKYIVISVGLLSAIYFLSAPFIAKIYISSDSQSYIWAIQVLRCHAVSLPFLAYNEFYQNLIQAEGKYKLTHLHSILNKCVCVVVLSFILESICGVVGIWLAIPLSEVVLMVGTIIIHGIRNIKDHNPGGFFCLVDRYDYVIQEIELHIAELDDIPNVVGDIKAFCNKNSLDSHTLYYLELFIEEISALILVINKEIKGLDIRICIDDNEIVIRTRDDGKPLTVMDKSKLYDKVQEEEHLGMQMIYKLSKDVKYVSVMNINNFIVTLPKY